MATSYSVVESEFPNEDGEYYFTITDGVQEKGEFATEEEARENLERIIMNWRADS